MAGEIKLNNVSIATENAGTVTIAPNNVQFAANHAGIKTALNASGDASIYACRAWVNFNGTGTVAIRESGNVSSITDLGTGDYTVNFTTAMVDANYCVTSTCSGWADLNTPTTLQTFNEDLKAPTTTSVRLFSAYTYTTSYQDVKRAYVAIFR